MVDLPPSASEKLSRLQRESDDARALVEQACKQMSDAERHILLSRKNNEDITRALATHVAAADLQKERYRRWQDAERLVAQCKGWISSLPSGAVIEVVSTLKPVFTLSPRQHVGML